MANDPIYYELLEACQQGGCPVCRVIIGQVDRYMDALFYENVNDIPTRAQLRKSLGFCSKHAWRLLDGEVGNALGIAIIYHDVIGNVLRNLPQTLDAPKKTGGLLKMFGLATQSVEEASRQILGALLPQRRCLVCQHQEQVGRLTIEILLEYLRDERLVEAFASSDGLCLPHLHQSLERSLKPQGRAFLLAVNKDRLASLHDDLAEYIRKNDYRFRDEDFGPESNSWRRAISKIQGEKGA
jgi:hypothetical protein